MQSYPQRSYGCDGPRYSSGGVVPAPMQGQQQMYRASNSASSYSSSAAAAYQQQMQMQKTSSFSSSSSHMVTVFGSDPFCDIQPSAFPPGTDPKVIECYNRIDRDGNGLIDDRELQSVLSSWNHSFSLRTVHLLMYAYTHSNKRVIGPKEFVPVLQCLQSWRSMFQRFDRDRNGSIDSMELGQALSSLNYCVSPVIVHMLVAKFNKSGRCSLKYDEFIECCLTVKGLTETFKARADNCGKASFCYEEFLLNVLPFIIA